MQILKFQNLFIIYSIFFIIPCIYAQQDKDEYVSLYSAGNYQKSLEIVIKKLEEINSARVEDKRVPTGFISTKDVEKEIDLIKFYRNRKAIHFFIEDNPELSKLHLYAARCYVGIKKFNSALNHYFQSLRFKYLENKDDEVFYEISQIYKKIGDFKGYCTFLESAYTLNPIKYKYSIELADSLYNTVHKKKAIYHYNRYLKLTDEDPDPKIFLKLGNLNEDIGRYLETEKNYIKYLTKKSDDGNIHYALGYIALIRTGNYALAQSSFDKALEIIPEKELTIRGKAFEYKADIAMNELEYDRAISFYQETIKYQEQILTDIKQKNDEIYALKNRINELKSSLIKEQNFDKYDEYENLLEKKGEKELDLIERENNYKKLDPGKTRWNIALAYEKLNKWEDALKFYQSTIPFDYKSRDVQMKILRLQLKIKRGY